MPTTFTVELPPGFTYKAGTTRHEQVHRRSPRCRSQIRRCRAARSRGRSIRPPRARTIHVRAYPGIELGPTKTSAQAQHRRRRACRPAASTADVTVNGNLEPSGLTTRRPISLRPSSCSRTSRPRPTATSTACRHRPPAAASRSISATFRSTTTSSCTGRRAGARAAAAGTPPLDGAAIDDPGVTPTHGTDALPPQTLDDVPIAAGRTVVGISANRGTQDDAVTFISQGGTTPYLIQISGFNGVSSNEPYMVRAEVLPPRAPAACAPALRRQRPAAPQRRSSRGGTGECQHRVRRQPPAARSASTPTRAAGRPTITAIKNQAPRRSENAGFPSSILQVDADPGRSRRVHGPNGWNACPSIPTCQRRRGRGRRARAAVQGRHADGAVRRPRRQRRRDPVRPARRPHDALERGCIRRLVRSGSPIGGALASRRCSPTTRTARWLPSRSSTGSSTCPELGVSRLVETPAEIQAQLDAFTTGQIAGGSALDDRLRLPHRRGDAGQDALGARRPGAANATLFPEPALERRSKPAVGLDSQRR